MLLRLLLGAILCLSTALRAAAANLADLDPAVQYETAAIKITGNRQFSDADLLAVMQTKTRPVYELLKRRPAFEPATFKADLDRIKRFYQVNGYYTASVDYDVTIKAKLVSANIRVSEGKPVTVKSIRIEGEAPAAKSLEPSFALPLKDGDTFTQSSYELGEAQLLQIYMHH